MQNLEGLNLGNGKRKKVFAFEAENLPDDPRCTLQMGAKIRKINSVGTDVYENGREGTVVGRFIDSEEPHKEHYLIDFGDYALTTPSTTHFVPLLAGVDLHQLELIK